MPLATQLWQEMSLEDCMDAIIDYRGKTPKKVSNGIPLITAKVIKGGRIETPSEFISESEYEKWMTRGLPLVGDIVITTEAPIGEVAQLSEEKIALAQRVILLRGKRGFLDNTFLKFLLQSSFIQDQLNGRASGSTVSGIKQSELRKIRLRFPPFDDQRKIAFALGSLDDKIENNRRMNETLEAMARALFKDWFVDFGPVRAKMEGREPPGLSPEVAALFPDALDEEGKPEGWGRGRVADYAFLNPENLTGSNYPSEVDYVDLSSTKWGVIESVVRFTRDLAPSRARRILRKGDTILGTVRPGNGSYAFINSNGMVGSTGFAVLRPKSEYFSEIIYLSVTDRENIERLSHIADGGAYPAVNPEVVFTTELIRPSDAVAKEFFFKTHPLMNRIESNKEEISLLSSLRDTLLPKLLSGELRVPETERMLESVA